MKKVFICVFLVLLLLTGCGKTAMPYGESSEIVDFSDGYIFESTSASSHALLSCDNNGGSTAAAVTSGGQASSQLQEKSSVRGVWLSYYEINVTNSRNTREKYASYIDSLCRSFQPYGITDLFAHVRAYGDAIYKSSVYPVSKYAAGTQGGELPFDLLEVICEVASEYGMRVHAWINPYRVHNGTDINELCADNKARQWYREDSNEDVAVVGEKIYFNPASLKAQQLVIEGAREILLNYPVAGIHIDDYFYPPNCGDFDSQQYSDYISSGGTLDLDSWRRSNVSSLVKGLYTTVKSFGNDKIFSVSPGGNINNNMNSLYADVRLWCKGGYADMIIPQIYFGFEHESHAFDECLNEWLGLKGEGVMMPVGLGLYKSGTEDAYAGTGKNEWQTRTDILARQVQYSRSVQSDGFVVFSCEFFDDTDTSAAAELMNLKNYLNQ